VSRADLHLVYVTERSWTGVNETRTEPRPQIASRVGWAVGRGPDLWDATSRGQPGGDNPG
jgi:hypothetical protein